MEYLIFCLTAYYLTRLLLFDADHGDGPQLGRGQVRTVHEEQIHIRPVTVFDWLRRLAGLYQVGVDSEGLLIWLVRAERLTLWTCPMCLSFWVALLLTFFYGWLMTPGFNWLLLPFWCLGAAGATTFLFHWGERT